MPIISILLGYLGAKHIILKHFIQPSPKKASIQEDLLKKQQYDTEYKLKSEESNIENMQMAPS